MGISKRTRPRKPKPLSPTDLLALHERSFVDWSESEYGFYVDQWFDERRDMWIENDPRPIRWPEKQRRALEWIFTIRENGRLPITELWWVDIGKSAKSLIGAAVVQWFGQHIAGNAEIQLAANSREHAGLRVYEALRKSLRLNPHGGQFAEWVNDSPGDSSKLVFAKTRNVVRPVSTRAGSVAGGNPILRQIDEIWDYEGEAADALVGELKASPTRNISFLLVTSYPSFEGDDGPLMRTLNAFFDRGVPRPGIEQVPGLEDLPLWVDPSTGAALWWNHDPYPWHLMRMPNGQTFIEQQLAKRDVTEPHKRRVWMAEVVQREDTFMPMDQWDECTDDHLLPLGPDDKDVPLVIAVDAASKHDSTAGVARDWDGDFYRLRAHKIITAKEAKAIAGDTRDMIQEIKEWVWQMHQRHNVLKVYYDPSHFDDAAADLKRRGVKIEEFTQNTMRTEADTHYRGLIIARRLKNYRQSLDLRDHVKNAVGVEQGNGSVRIDKRKSSKKIDAAVADSMCCYGVKEHKQQFMRLIQQRGRKPLPAPRNVFNEIFRVRR